MKRLSYLLSVLALLLTQAGCFEKETSTKSALPPIVVTTLMSHPALDAVEKGVIRGLSEDGLVAGRDFRLVERNANGQMQMTASIAGDLATQSPAVVVAIATPMAQAVKSRWHGPLVFAAVTDPVGAGLVPSLRGSEMVTGTSDAWPYRAQLKLIRRIQPNVATIGVLFNPGEAASQYGMAQIHQYAPLEGLKVVEFPVSSTIEVAAASKLALTRTDALLLSSDNTVISAVSAAFQAAVDAQKALYVGDSGTVERGGLATVSVGYGVLGLETGRLAARMFRGQRNLPVVVASGHEIFINRKAAQLMGITVPNDVINDATHVFDAIAR